MARELVRRSLPSGRTARVVMSEAADGDLLKTQYLEGTIGHGKLLG